MKMKTVVPNLWDVAQVVPRGKFIAMQFYLKKILSHPPVHLNELEKKTTTQNQQKEGNDKDWNIYK